MRWRGRARSTNVEDRRGSGGRVAAAGGGLGVIVVAVVIMLLGGNPQQFLQQQQQAAQQGGVVLHHTQRTKQIIEPGDVEEALRAAAAIGDDRLQKQSQGYTVPESFTHGTSEQRLRWFRRGLETGDFSQGDTFSVREL
ncbi:neutral zinc metallopeptidase [Planctomycetes bacterium TBK1r]|uniref:Neutral zinc metallopeptidase n=1 Tax=Stieleria magnilauensis TaxID=2527963 RepID=A0ABX5Y3M6_9BACT|nr:Putative neutral zinc metallopeptidase [Planctomycetes bacterium TBK1r]